MDSATLVVSFPIKITNKAKFNYWFTAGFLSGKVYNLPGSPAFLFPQNIITSSQKNRKVWIL